MCGSPRAAKARNQTTMTGPKNLPTRSVPWRCTTNSAVITAIPSGTTHSRSPGWETSRPSIADITEIAGVMRESP